MKALEEDRGAVVMNAESDNAVIGIERCERGKGW